MKFTNLVPNEPTWLRSHVILFGKCGSFAYGTATESSDYDFKGICIPPIDYFLGLNYFEGYDKNGGKNFKNKPGDIDVNVIHISKFVREAMKGIPNNLEMLCLEKEDYLYLDEFGEELIAMRKHFFSKQIMKKYGGYAKSQSNVIRNSRSNGKGRMDLVELYGYDTKAFMHTVRLYEMAIEILLTGDMKAKRPNADFLIQLRRGYYSLKEALAYIEKLEEKLKRAYEESTLPESPDTEFINRWLSDFNMRYLLKAS